MMEVTDLELHNRDGNTAFCLAVIAGNVGMAKIMVEKNPALPKIRGRDNMIPLYLAAFHGKHDMVTYLYDQHQRMKEDEYWTNDIRDEVLLKCMQAGIFDVGLQILNDHKDLPQDKNLWDALQILARNSNAFMPDRSSNVLIRDIKQIVSSFLAFIGLGKIHAALLLRLLWKRIMEKPKYIIDGILKGPMTQMGTYPSHVLFIATRVDNSKFLVELIREYPDLIRMRNDDGQSIFHASVSHRCPRIYNLIYGIGSMKDTIATMTDQQGNNILHLVAMNPEGNPYKDFLSVPSILRSELFWYQKVWAIVPPPLREAKNAAGQTPREIFNDNHKNLLYQGEKWIKQTINQSMVVGSYPCIRCIIFSSRFNSWWL